MVDNIIDVEDRGSKGVGALKDSWEPDVAVVGIIETEVEISRSVGLPNGEVLSSLDQLEVYITSRGPLVNEKDPDDQLDLIVGVSDGGGRGQSDELSVEKFAPVMVICRAIWSGIWSDCEIRSYFREFYCGQGRVEGAGTGTASGQSEIRGAWCASRG